MAKFNFQKLSREQKFKNKPIVNSVKNNTTNKKIHFNDTNDVILNGSNYILKFGKYKGEMIKDVPLEYIVWAAENITSAIVNTFVREIERRKNIIDTFIVSKDN